MYRRRLQRILHFSGHGTRTVDPGRPGVRKHGVRELVQGIYAPPEQVGSVNVVVGGPFEEFPAALVDQKVVVPGQADVFPLPEHSDTGVTSLIVMANVRRAISGGVI